MNEGAKDDLKNLINRYDRIVDLVNRNVRDNMTEAEETAFLRFLDELEILILRAAKTLVDTAELNFEENN